MPSSVCHPQILPDEAELKNQGNVLLNFQRKQLFRTVTREASWYMTFYFSLLYFKKNQIANSFPKKSMENLYRCGS